MYYASFIEWKIKKYIITQFLTPTWSTWSRGVDVHAIRKHRTCIKKKLKTHTNDADISKHQKRTHSYSAIVTQFDMIPADCASSKLFKRRMNYLQRLGKDCESYPTSEHAIQWTNDSSACDTSVIWHLKCVFLTAKVSVTLTLSPKSNLTPHARVSHSFMQRWSVRNYLYFSKHP